MTLKGGAGWFYGTNFQTVQERNKSCIELIVLYVHQNLVYLVRRVIMGFKQKRLEKNLTLHVIQFPK